MKAYLNSDWNVISKTFVVDDVIAFNSCSFGYVSESLSPYEKIRRILNRILIIRINSTCKIIIRHSNIHQVTLQEL